MPLHSFQLTNPSLETSFQTRLVKEVQNFPGFSTWLKIPVLHKAKLGSSMCYSDASLCLGKTISP